MLIARIVVLALLGAACQSPPEAPRRAEPDPILARGVDRRVSTYKDPQPPRTAPPPGVAPKARRGTAEPAAIAISGRTRNEELSRLRFRVPVEWAKVGSSPTRAEFALPGAEGDAGLVLSFKPDEVGADVASIVRQWRARFVPPRGAAVEGRDVPVQAVVRGPLWITRVDLGVPADNRGDEGPPQRMFAAIIVGADAPYRLEAVGPAPTMARWEQALADVTTTFAIDPPP